jgi:hypothetical protein
MAAKGGLFAVSMPPALGGDDEEADDYSDDAAPAEGAPEPDELGAGPFDAYAETVFDEKADVPTKSDALRQAILCILEERGGK